MVWPGVKAMGLFPASRANLAELMPSTDFTRHCHHAGKGAVFVEVMQQPLFVITDKDGVVHRQPPLTTCLISAIVNYDRKPGRLSAVSLGRARGEFFAAGTGLVPRLDSPERLVAWRTRSS